MGCFLGCFGGKDQKRRKQRTNRTSPPRQKTRVPNVQQEVIISAEQSPANTCGIKSDSELRNEIEGVEQSSPSSKRKVAFNSDVTTYEHVSVHESIDSQPECTTNIANEKVEESNSISVDDNSVASSVGSYPPNHRYHNARDSDDEVDEGYGDSGLDDLDEFDDEDDYDENNEDTDVKICDQEGLLESVLTSSAESRTGDCSKRTILDKVESPVVGEEVREYGSKTNARGRSDYVNSVLNPIENITQWKAAKSKRGNVFKPKISHEEAALPRISFSSEPTFGDTVLGNRKYEKPKKNTKQEIAVDASLSNWLAPPQIVRPGKNDHFSGLEADKSVHSMSGGCTPPRSFEDRPILGALTIEELKQISASASPRKSPSRSPDEMPIIGTVGTYWNHLSAAKHVDSPSSFKGIPNSTSKYREDKRVNWHSTPFEKRLDRALDQGAAEA